MTKKNRVGIIGGTIWSILDNAAAQAITFVVFVILARFLDAGIYGMLAISVLVIQFFRTVFFDSVATAILRKESPTEEDYNSAFMICTLFSIPAFIIVILLTPFIESILKIKDLAFVIRWTSVSILLYGFSRIFEAWLNHNFMFKQLAIRSIISISIAGVIGIYLAYKGYGIVSLMAQQVLSVLISLVVLFFTTPWRPTFRVSASSLKEIFSYGKHVSLSGITNFANQNSDIFFISFFLGAPAAGLYSVGKRVVNTFTTVLSSALMRVSLPAFSRLKNNVVKLREQYINATFFTILITAPMFFGLSVLSKDITLLVFGNQWAQAIPIMQIVSFTGCLVSIGYYNHSIMFACDKPHWQSRLTLAYAITNVLFFLLFVRFGIVVTAISFTVRTVLMYPFSVWCALKLLDIKWMDYCRIIYIPLVSASIMLLSIFSIDRYWLSDAIWSFTILKIIVGMCVYMLSLMLFLPKKNKTDVVNFLIGLKSR